MAIFFRGLDDRELADAGPTRCCTRATCSICRRIARAKIDKHSTGGVGDKISIPLAPAVAACGVAVPMISGRGLGHTGGTLDKLESIPGFRVDLSVAAVRARSSTSSACCLIGQTARIAPADKRLYALRDVTGDRRVAPADRVVDHVEEARRGHRRARARLQGRPRRVHEDARARARAVRARCARSAPRAGKRITCVLTDMDAPLGRTIGNALEIRESIEVLRGGGPGRYARADARARRRDAACSAASRSDRGRGPRADRAGARRRQALEVFRKVVEAQGGDPRVVRLARQRAAEAAASRRARAARRAGSSRSTPRRSASRRSCSAPAGARKEDAIDPARRARRRRYRRGRRAPACAAAVMLHHSLPPEDARLAEARAMIERAFVIEPVDRPAPPLAAVADPRGDPMSSRATTSRSAVAAVRARVAPARAPQVGLILGSGLGAFADTLERRDGDRLRGHPGLPARRRRRPRRQPRARRARAASRCVAMQGRVHMYEGHERGARRVSRRACSSRSARRSLIITNAAGGARPDAGRRATLMLIRDHLDLLARLTAARPERRARSARASPT